MVSAEIITVPVWGIPSPPFNVQSRTPGPALVNASDDVLERLVPVIREGAAAPGQMPFDDPIPLYEDSPQRE